MNEPSVTAQPVTPLPSDNLRRTLKVSRPDTDESLPHIGLVGDTYTILLSGADTDGRYCLIDMHIPPGGGPPPHRHDFEESFTVLEGEIEATFRGEKSIVHAGREHPGQRAAFLYQRLRERGPATLHLCAGRAGRILRASWGQGAHSKIHSAGAQPGRTSGLNEESARASPEVPDGASAAVAAVLPQGRVRAPFPRLVDS